MDASSSAECCDGCGKQATSSAPLKRCTACTQNKYCSVKCQKKDWKDGHKEACQTLQAMKRALDAATPRGPNEPFWKSFWKQATVENVKKLRHDEIGFWKVHLDEKNNLVVTDECTAFAPDGSDEVVVGHGPCPETSEDILEAIYACMIMPENDHCPRRPNTITLDTSLERHYKYLWSEMLRIPLQIWRDNDEDRAEARSCATFPIRRWGKYEKGEVFYEPQLKLRIEYWTDERRREFMDKVLGWEDTMEYAKSVLEFGYDMEEKQPRWARDYDSLENCLEAEGGEDDESERAYWKEEIYEWQHDYETEEKMCMDHYNAKTIEECAWDMCGVPRLYTEDENADKTLESAGWECQGYKPGRCFAMTEDSVKLGQRLVHYNGYMVWEEKRPPRESMEDMYASYVSAHLRG